MNKILVIGGNGFIGQNIIKCLKKHGEYVGSYDLNRNKFADESYSGNIETDQEFDDIIAKYDCLVYLITTVSPKKSMECPEKAYKNDIPLLLKTLDACRKSGIKRVIFSSSGGTVYGDNGEKKSTENDFNEPINHYAVCKLSCEKILEMYNKLYGMENLSLRIANPYGTGQNPKSGVGAITAFMDMVNKGQKIDLYGDGSITRDFVDVEDVSEAFYLATIWDFRIDIIPVFNIGSGYGISLINLIEIIAEVLNKHPEINYLPERSFDVHYNVLDITKAKNILGYNPENNVKEKIKKYISNLIKGGTNE